MFNNSVYNGEPYNGSLPVIEESSDDIAFNNYGIQNENIVIKSTNRDDMATIQINSWDRPQGNGGGVLSRYYKDKQITMQGYVKGDTEADLITYADTLKSQLDQVEGYLDVTFGSAKRRIKATCSNVSMPRDHYNITYLPFTLTFLCKEPFFYDKNATETTFLGKTASFQDNVSNTGYAEVYPTVYITFSAASSVTSIALNIEGTTLTISQAITAPGLIEIDCLNKKVYYNGTEIDYTGIFPQLIRNNNAVTFTINGTWTADISVFYNKTYK